MAGVFAVFVVAWMLLWFAASVLVCLGAWRMWHLRGRKLAFAAAVIITIQGFLGLLFSLQTAFPLTLIWSVLQLGTGVWVFIVLSLPEAQKRFADFASRTSATSLEAEVALARKRVAVPATGLMIISALNLLLLGGLLVFFLLGVKWHSSGGTDSLSLNVPGVSVSKSMSPGTGVLPWWMIGGPVLVLLGLCLALLTFLGAWRMRQLRSYGLAVTGAVLGIFTPPGMVLGFIFGLWALIVLSRSKVRAAFRAGAGGPSSTGKSSAGCLAVGCGVLGVGVILVLLLVVVPLIFLGARRSQVRAVNAPISAPQAPKTAPRLLQNPVFGPVLERVIQARPTGTNLFLDLDTGALLTPPDSVSESLVKAGWQAERFWQALDIPEDSQAFRYIHWLRESGADLMYSSPDGVVGFDALFPLAHGKNSTNWDSWDELTPTQVQNDVAVLEWTRKVAQAAKRHESRPPAPKPGGIVNSAAQLDSSSPGGPIVNSLTLKQSTLWFFKTRKGAMGVLQILGPTDDPLGIKLRYKLLQSSLPNSPPVPSAPVVLPPDSPPVPVVPPPADELEPPVPVPPAYLSPPTVTIPIAGQGELKLADTAPAVTVPAPQTPPTVVPLAQTGSAPSSAIVPSLSDQWYQTNSPGSIGARGGFAPEIERVIKSGETGSSGLVFVNVERNEVARPPFAVKVDWSTPAMFQRSARLDEWVAASGMDFALHLGDINWGFVPLGAQLVTHSNYVGDADFLDVISPARARELLTEPKTRKGHFESLGAHVASYPASAGYIFKTRSGTCGLLQIGGFTNGSPGVRLRYRLAQSEEPKAPVEDAAKIDADLKVRLAAAERIFSFTERDAAMAAIARDAGRAGNATRARQAVSRMFSFSERDHAALAAARELLKKGLRAEAVDIAQTITSFSERDAALKELVK